MHNGSLPPKPKAAFAIGQQGLATRWESYVIGLSETLELVLGNMAKGRMQIEACLQHPQRAVRVLADVPSPELPFHLEMRSDHSTLQVKDFLLRNRPEPTRVIAMNTQDLIDRSGANLQRPRNKPNPVKPVHALEN
jgi:hypothetical protein